MKFNIDCPDCGAALKLDVSDNIVESVLCSCGAVISADFDNDSIPVPFVLNRPDDEILIS